MAIHPSQPESNPGGLLQAVTDDGNQQASKPHLYWPALDGLRTLAFLMVFVHHAGYPNLAGNPVGTGLHALSSWGWMGVDLFFVLSAFLITSLLLQERQVFGSFSFRLFFIRRALRIWPLYFAALALGFFLLPYFGWSNVSWGSPPWRAVLDTYLVPFSFFFGNFQLAKAHLPPVPALLAPLWSVCSEEQFYIIWGLLLTRLRKPRTLAITLVALFTAANLTRFWLHAHSNSHHSFYYNTLSHLDPILIGAGLAALSHYRPDWLARVKPYAGWAFVGSMLILGFILGFLPDYSNDDISLVWAFTGIAIAWGLFLAATLHWEPLRRLFAHPVLARIGRLTYGMYVFHPLGLDIATPITIRLLLFPHPLVYWAEQLILGLICTYGLAILSWHLLEKHFTGRRKFFSRVLSGFQAT
jgi:peptidoglycan/LPS O-acetylase OafA/YrhL